MRVIYLLLLLLSSVATQSLSHPTSKRRILHQPLYPVDSAPPPSIPPPPPPSLPDQPFFPESPPNGQTPDQNQLTPPSSPSNLSSAAPLPVASQPPGHTKKVAIALSVAIVTLGMLSALAFFLYRHRATHPTEAQKLVGSESGGVAPPPQAGSDFLYLGTMEPSGRRSASASASGSERNGGITASPSPYHKLNSLRDAQFHRPSPELQPLPPLRRAQIENNSSIGSPLKTNYTSSVASSDDVFFSPNASVDNSSVPSVKNVIHTSNSSNPHSRRSSPKSRLSYSTPPDVKQVIVASPPSQDPQSLNSQPRTPSPPKRKTKFSSPPSPPSSNSDVIVRTTQASRITVPPPPPPPPPPPSSVAVAAKKDIPPEKNVSVAAKLVREVPRPQSMMPTPTRPMGAEAPVPVVDVTQSSASSDSQVDAEDEDGAKPKLKPLHWDKVRATSDRAMVWDQFKSSSFHLNEDRIETLFGCNTKNPVKKESPRTSVLPQLDKENRVLDPKKSQNIAILLRALNVTRDEVSEALLEGNPDGLGAELLETLVKMAPTKEEELKLRDYSGDISKLGTAERFLKAILDVPFAFKRVDAMLYRANFDTEVKYLRKSFEALQAACEELKNSRLFLKLLEAVLRTGNRMNVGTNRGDAKAFKLDTLLKLLDIKGVDGKTTVLHFVVQEIIRSEAAVPDKAPDSPLNKVHPRVKDDDIQKQGLQVVAGLGRELANVKKAAGMDSDVLHSYVSKLEVGLEKVRTVLQYEKSNTKGKFFEAMKLFLGEAHEEILRVKGEEKKSLYHVKEVTEYFHGDTAKEEAHPFRIFMVVRDFLTVLDQVCREVGRIQERTVVGSARSFRMPASASLPVLNRYNVRRDASSDEDSSSP